MKKILLKLFVTGACFGATLAVEHTQASADINFKRGIPAVLRYSRWRHAVKLPIGDHRYDIVYDKVKFGHTEISAYPGQGERYDSRNNYYYKVKPRTYIFRGKAHDTSVIAGSKYNQEYFYVKLSKNYRALKSKVGWTSKHSQYLPKHYYNLFGESKEIFHQY